MEDHACTSPLERRRLEDAEWTCPDCGAPWVARPRASIGSAPTFDFASVAHVVPAEWRRVDTHHAGAETAWVVTWDPTDADLHCSFCGKPREAVRKLIAGPGSGSSRVLICDECVDLCVEIITEEEAEEDPSNADPPAEH